VRSRCSKLNGFTLIELLTAMGVLVILVGLLLGGIAKAKAKARDATCINNLRQHGIALAKWLADHDSFPLHFSDPTLGKTEERYVFWEKALFIAENLDCEDKASVANCPAISQPKEYPPPQVIRDYGYNAWGLNGPGKRPLLGIGGHGPMMIFEGKSIRGDYSPPVKESEVASPSEFLAIGDAFIGWNSTIEDDKGTIGRTSSAADRYGSSARAPKRHRGRANMLYADGHVVPETLGFLFMETSDAALRVWNRDNLPHRERLAE
jgi:prepilin-type processing-associated H-X9-DG protein/prepilin-type N-terminal cleavage/methylation domain-containing protein